MSAAAKIARRSGFRVQYILPGLKDYSVFQNAKLWVQPGGKSTTAAASMGPALLNRIREFVADGGGYVGFCAGAFLSTGKIGTSGADGYGIIPGETELLIKTGSDHKMLKVWTPNGPRWVFYAGGPFLKVTDDQLAAVDGHVIARYSDNSVAGVEVRYGKGKVAVVGFHPEANWLWKLAHFKIDPDGKDFDYAEAMVKYATSP